MTAIHLLQVSSEAFDPSRQATTDFATDLGRHPDGGCVTEVTVKGHRPELAAVCKRLGFHMFGGIGDTCLVTPHKILDKGTVMAHSGGRDASGVYGQRDAVWITCDIRGERVTLIGAHWPRPLNAARIGKHQQTTDVVIKLAREHSRGTDLAFVLGDVNEHLDGTGRAQTKFAAAGITPAWTELDYLAPTGPGGKTIDLGASVNNDRRVTAVAAIPWPIGYSDHPAVSFIYDTEPRP